MKFCIKEGRNYRPLCSVISNLSLLTLGVVWSGSAEVPGSTEFSLDVAVVVVRFIVSVVLLCLSSFGCFRLLSVVVHCLWVSPPKMRMLIQ